MVILNYFWHQIQSSSTGVDLFTLCPMRPRGMLLYEPPVGVFTEKVKIRFERNIKNSSLRPLKPYAEQLLNIKNGQMPIRNPMSNNRAEKCRLKEKDNFIISSIG